MVVLLLPAEQALMAIFCLLWPRFLHNVDFRTLAFFKTASATGPFVRPPKLAKFRAYRVERNRKGSVS
jgi:hypothetical protein